MSDTVEIRCTVTGKTAQTRMGKDGPVLPKGWKRYGEAVYSPDAVRNLYVPRGLTVPVHSVEVLPKSKTEVPVTGAEAWREFRRCLTVSWRQCAQVGNWLLRQLAAADPGIPERQGSKVALPPIARNTVKTITQRARALFTHANNPFVAARPEDEGKLGLDSQSLYSIVRRAESRYKEHRWRMHVECRESMPSFRDGEIPLPIEAKDSPLEVERDGVVALTLRIAGTRFRVRLRNTDNFARQLGPIRRAAAGELMRGAISLRENHDRQVLLTCAVSLPRELVLRDSTEGMLVRTATDALLIGEATDTWDLKRANYTVTFRLFTLNDDELLRWQAAHREFLRRLAEDRKAETRPVRHWRGNRPVMVSGPEEDPAKALQSRRRHRRNLQRALETRCAKHHRRVSDRLHKIAAMVANWAVRRRVHVVFYDDRERSFAGSLPYHRLRQLIREKLDHRGIALEVIDESGSSGCEATDVPGGTPSPTAATG